MQSWEHTSKAVWRAPVRPSEEQISMCCHLLLQGRLTPRLGWPQPTCLCVRQLYRDGWSHVTLTLQFNCSSKLQSARPSEESVCLLPPHARLTPRPPQLEGPPAQNVPRDSPPPNSYLLWWSIPSCIKLSLSQLKMFSPVSLLLQKVTSTFWSNVKLSP